jgi:hypothetical protein
MTSSSGRGQCVDKNGYTEQHRSTLGFRIWPPPKMIKRYSYSHESGVRSMIELRKEDLSAMESTDLSQMEVSRGKCMGRRTVIRFVLHDG